MGERERAAKVTLFIVSLFDFLRLLLLLQNMIVMIIIIIIIIQE